MAINLSKEQRLNLAKQCASEMDTAITYLTPIWRMYDAHWDIYKNEVRSYKRREFRVQDYSTFSIMQQLTSLLTQDAFDFRLKANSPDDVGSVALIDKILRYDFIKSNRQFIEQQLVWNTLFFGEGNILLYQYNKVKGRTKTERDYYSPIATVINQRTFLYNPTSIKGQGQPDGAGAYQYAGFPTITTKRQVEKYKDYYTVESDTFKRDTKAVGFDSVSFATVIQGENQRRSGSYNVAVPYVNDKQEEYQVNEAVYLFSWFTFFEEKPIMVIFLNDFNTIVRYEELKFDELPFITRPLYPVTNAKNLISIPYLVQDKQKAKQALNNLAIENEIKKQTGLWVFDDSKITDYRSLLQQTGGFIPIQGSTQGVIDRIPQGSTDNATDFILDSLSQAENRDVGITQQQRGSLTDNVRSAREIAATSESADNRALAIRRRWKTDISEYVIQSIRIYDNLSSGNFHNKIIRVSGDLEDEFLDLSRREFKRVADVDVEVIDTLEEEEKRIQELPYTDRIFQQALAYQGTNRRELMKYTSKKLGITREEIDKLYPPTGDERLARIENTQLANKEDVPISILQNHEEHLIVHENAESNSATKAHIQRHILAMIAIQQNQRVRQRLAEMQAQEQAAQEQQQGQGQQSIGQNLNNLALQGTQSGRLSAGAQALPGGGIVNDGTANQQ